MNLNKCSANVVAVSCVLDSAGVLIAPDSMAQTMSWNGDGTLAYVTATDGVDTWKQTYSYTAGKLTSQSLWVKQ